MKKFPSSLSDKLHNRKQSNAFRTLMETEGLVDFCSNDYLGAAQLVFDSEALFGSTGSRLISGNSKRSVEIEEELAIFYKQQSALLFNSGYDANLGLFSSVPLKGDTVIYDALVHASIRDGIRMSLANSFPFKHNDTVQLEEKILRAKGNVYVAVEGIYSMDGDEVALNEIVEICERHGAHLIIDEAHSGGVLEDLGRGLVSSLNLDDRIFAKVMTFGKAYGSHGAVVLGAAELKDYLVNFARSLIYTTALSPHSQERILNVVEMVSGLKAERNRLQRNILFFKSIVNEGKHTLLKSNSPIQCILIPGNTDVKNKAQKILESGFAVKAILSPTVQEGKERIRICLHSFNSEKEIKDLTAVINE